jgi:hypothetical protein
MEDMSCPLALLSDTVVFSHDRGIAGDAETRRPSGRPLFCCCIRKRLTLCETAIGHFIIFPEFHQKA